MSTVLLGAAGSGLFWLILKVLNYLAVALRRFLGDAAAVADRQKKFKEYIYRRYTSRDGILNTLTGHQITYTRAFREFLNGMIFVCVAFLLGGSTRIIWGIALVGAIVFFWSALSWVSPSASWMGDDMVPHWNRVAELEQELFGEIDKRTQEILAETLKAQESIKTGPSRSQNAGKSD
jgi:hypothetical protein